MTDQNSFMEVLAEVKEIMRTSQVPMSEKEIMSYFDDMELSNEQKMLVLDYLKNAPDKQEDNGDPDLIAEVDDGKTGIDDAAENSKVLRAYMEDLSLLETCTEEEINVLYRRLFSGESEVIEIIMAAWLKKVIDIAGRYIDLHAKLEDLIQEGNVALLMRLNQLCGTPDCSDAEKGFDEVEENLSRVIERGIMDYISEWNSEKEQENSLIGKLSLVHEAENYLESENGTKPTIGELAAFTKLSEEELKMLKDFINK